jgi:UDP:flavonoid glycosyltransferase YjiC (YdhE family)
MAQARRKILIATSGSLGDLHPFVALAHALASEGLEPVVATCAYYRDYILSEGLAFAPIRPDLDDMSRDVSLDLHGIARAMAKEDGFLFRKLIFPYLHQAYEDISAAAEGASLIVAHALAFPAQAVAEKRGLPLANVILSPLLLPSAYDPPDGAFSPYVLAPRNGLSRAYNRFMKAVTARAVWLWAAPLRSFRTQLGLQNQLGAGPFSMGWHADATIALYSPLLAPLQPDHPPGTAIAGHSFHDRHMNSGEELRPALEAFFDAGAPPIVFTLGSFFARDRVDHFRACVDAAQDLGRRAILMLHADDLAELGDEFSKDVMALSYVPHSWLFPRACAVVHHGGVGTSGQAMRSGVPQLVTPVMGDQFDNAARLERLGVARTLVAKKATVASLGNSLSILLTDENYARRARELAPSLEREDGARAAARIISQMLNRNELGRKVA